MEKFNLLALAILVTSLSHCSPSKEAAKIPTADLKVMTFNIRLNRASDGDNAWPKRQDKVASMIRFYAPDVFGVQEALEGQMIDLAERLPEYGWLGVGRDDGAQAGEYMAIFYLKDRINVLSEATFWLSEQPDQPGLGWDAACNRVVTWGQFKDLKTDRTFFHFNTHFDHLGPVARRESAQLLLTKVKAIAGNHPVIVTGDFNSRPDSEPYQILTTDTDLLDTKTISDTPHHGPTRTFNGFDLESLKTVDQPIDHIFVTSHFQVLKHATLSDTIDGYFPSDHMPVLTQVVLK